MSVLFTLSLLFLVGCGGGGEEGNSGSKDDGNPSASDQSDFVEYGVAGNIVEITPSEDEAISGTIRVEGPEENGATYKEAVVTITPNTIIYLSEATNFESLEVGMYVNVFLEDDVKESQPIQATAKQINIIPKDSE